MNKVYHLLLLMLLMLAGVSLSGCRPSAPPVSEREESLQAKQLLQGVWIDEDSETAVFQLKGDTVYYPDSTSMPVAFKVIDDTLYFGSSTRYHIERHSEHVLWLSGSDGETKKYAKSDDAELKQVFRQSSPKILTLTGVLKRDTVVFHDGERYHLYVAVNPTRYKVTHQTVNDDGLEVQNVYYDNIIHVSVFRGATSLFSRDFRKNFYQKSVPSQVLVQSVLNNIEYDSTDSDGFHFRASICVPGDASCYLVEHVISFDGRLATHLLEY